MTTKEQFWAEMLAAPRAFLYGLLGGLFGPVVALAGAVGLIYALTRQLPAIKDIQRSDGGRGKALVLAPQAEARASWIRFGADLRGTMLELRARK
jgi:hypothetical protein